VLTQLEAFLVKHGLIEKGTGRWLKKFCWCSDGPFDIRDFVVKQCFISRVRSMLGVELKYLSGSCSTIGQDAFVAGKRCTRYPVDNAPIFELSTTMGP